MQSKVVMKKISSLNSKSSVLSTLLHWLRNILDNKIKGIVNTAQDGNGQIEENKDNLLKFKSL